MENTKTILILMATMLLAGTFASAVNVGVLVEFPNGDVIAKCLDVSENTNAYEVLGKTGLNIGWSESGMFGHGLCMINNTGCPPSNCYCDTKYWGFYIAKQDEKKWVYSPVGFDGGEVCWNRDQNSFDGHYCAIQGDVLGFKYAGFGDTPVYLNFKDICVQKSDKDKVRKSIGLNFNPVKVIAGEPVTVTVVDNNSLDPLRDAEVGVYPGTPEFTKSVYEGKTGKDGSFSFTLNKTGEYLIMVIRYNYPRGYFKFNVNAPEKIVSQSPPTPKETTTLLEETTTAESTTTVKETTSIRETTIKEETTTLKENPTTTQEAKPNMPTGFAVETKTPAEQQSEKPPYILPAILGLAILTLLYIKKKI